MNRILIVKTSSLGDIIHAYPVVDYLHQKFPSAQIDWVVEESFADLVKKHPLINRTITLSTKKWRKKPLNKETLRSIRNFRNELQKDQYDVVFDLQGNIKSGLIVSQVRASHKVGFGKRSVSEWPNVFFNNRHFEVPSGNNIRHDYLFLTTSFFNDPLSQNSSKVSLCISEEESAIIDKLKKNSVVVCPGSAWKNKQLPPETLKQFLKLLSDHLKCFFLFVWGSEQEKMIAQELHHTFAEQSQIVDKMPLPMLQNLMDQSSLIIAMDSLPLHLAGTTKTPSFSVFGASSASKYKPLGGKHHTFQGTCPYGKSFEKRCPILRTCETGACIHDINAAELFESFKSWWDRECV